MSSLQTKKKSIITLIRMLKYDKPKLTGRQKKPKQKIEFILSSTKTLHSIQDRKFVIPMVNYLEIYNDNNYHFINGDYQTYYGPYTFDILNCKKEYKKKHLANAAKEKYFSH